MSNQTRTLDLQDEILDANQRYKDKLAIRHTSDRGYGVFSSKDYSQGDIVIVSRALDVSNVQGRHTIQTGWSTHVYMDLPARFLNHICSEPNLIVRANEWGAYNFRALRSIAQNEELTFDYETTEFDLSGFKCRCGSKACRGELKGFRVNKSKVLEAFRTNEVAPYFWTS